MFKRSVACLFLLSGLTLAGCGGGGKGAPMLPAAPAPTASAGASQSTKSKASFVVTIPKATPAPLGAKRPAYVSPSTQSMTVSVLQGSTSVLSQTVGLTASSTGCASSLASVTCTLTLNLNPGSYTASITTYDAANGKGNQLSTAQNVSFTVAANQNNVVPLGLSGIPASVVALAGNTTNSVYVLALDADGNFIVGPGAPTFTTSASGAKVATITGPTTTAPNTISFALASPAPAPGTETVNVTASYPSGQTNGCPTQTVCTLATPISVTYSDGIAFVNNYEFSNLIGFTLPLSSNSQAPAYTIEVPSYPEESIGVNSSGAVFSAGDGSTGPLVAASPPYTGATTVSNSQGLYYPYGQIGAAPNGDVFVPDYDSNSVAELVPPYTAAPTQITNGVYYPYAVAADSNNNLYVGNDNDTVSAYASPYTSAPVTVNTTSTPYSFAISGSTLFVGESSNVDIFTLPLTASSTPITLSGFSYVYGLAADSSGNIWVACYESCTGGGTYGAVLEFKKSFVNGESPSVNLTMPAAGFQTKYPYGVGFDAAGNLYVLNYEYGAEDGGLLEYSGTITSSSTPTYGIETGAFYDPEGLAITPPAFTVTP